jgi:hypothetical protein
MKKKFAPGEWDLETFYTGVTKEWDMIGGKNDVTQFT